MLDPGLAFWTLALADLAAVAGCAAAGVRRIRRGDVAGHRRMMLGAAALVALFLVAYASKLAWLGHEDLAAWSPADRRVLYVHELCVAVMLASGGYAGWRAWRFRRRIEPTLERRSPRRERVHHRRAGWVAVVASGLGLATALAILAGMYTRAAA